MGVLSLDATDSSGMRWFDLPEVCTFSASWAITPTGAVPISFCSPLAIMYRYLRCYVISAKCLPRIWYSRFLNPLSARRLLGTGLEHQVFYAFHVLNAWEEQIKTTHHDGAAPTYHSVVKIITLDAFDIDLELPVGIQGLSEGELLF